MQLLSFLNEKQYSSLVCKQTILKRVIFSWGDVKKSSFGKNIFSTIDNILFLKSINFNTTAFLGIKKARADFALAKDSR